MRGPELGGVAGGGGASGGLGSLFAMVDQVQFMAGNFISKAAALAKFAEFHTWQMRRS